jgi:hypothetical protein
MKKFILVLFCLGALGWSAFRIFNQFLVVNSAVIEETEEENSVPLRALDVDALAARLPKYQELYQKLRDDSFAAYAKLHPVAVPPDEATATTLRLAAYLCVWGDFYEEDLWTQCETYTQRVLGKNKAGENDPLIVFLKELNNYVDRHSTNDDDVERLAQSLAPLEKTDYPPVYKFWAHLMMTRNLVKAKRDAKADPMEKSFALVPSLIGKMVEYYRLLVQARWPDEILQVKGDRCIDDFQKDEDILVRFASALDAMWAQEAPDSVVRADLQGCYYTSYAWNARGTGWASTVTSDGWRLMKERLAQAAEILDAAYARHPESNLPARSMIIVVMGQGQGHDLMEMWFHRAMQADPDDYLACQRKMTYLRPRWHGSIREMWEFGLACAQTEKWTARLPLMLVTAAEEMGERNPKVFADPKIWEPLERVLRSYLERYPDSMCYRSYFAKFAAQGGHWNIAQEQFTLLGANWNRNLFSNQEYSTLKRAAEKNSQHH